MRRRKKRVPNPNKETKVIIRVVSRDALWDAIDKKREGRSYSVKREYQEKGKWCAEVSLFGAKWSTKS